MSKPSYKGAPSPWSLMQDQERGLRERDERTASSPPFGDTMAVAIAAATPPPYRVPDGRVRQAGMAYVNARLHDPAIVGTRLWAKLLRSMSAVCFEIDRWESATDWTHETLVARAKLTVDEWVERESRRLELDEAA